MRAVDSGVTVLRCESAIVSSQCCAECAQKWEARHRQANEPHLHLGCRGINPFQASGLKSYEYAYRLFQFFIQSSASTVCVD